MQQVKEKKTKISKTKVIKFRLSEENFVKIKDFSVQKTNGNVSKFILSRAMGDRDIVPVKNNIKHDILASKASELKWQLNKIGINFNQFVKKISINNNEKYVKKSLEICETFLKQAHENILYFQLFVDKQ